MSSARRGQKVVRRARSLAAVALLTASMPVEAWAAQFETEIDIRNEDDLLELYRSGQISSETYETLTDLLQEGVDLNAATRDELYELPNLTYQDVDAILLYRAQAGAILAAEDLVVARAIPEHLLAQIAPFLLPPGGSDARRSLGGKLRVGSGWSPFDDAPPPVFVRGRVSAAMGLKAGVLAMAVRRRLGEVVYDPSRDALTASPPGLGLQVPKYYLLGQRGGYSAILGSYRIGFAQRLTLDNTNRNTPDGFYPDDDVVISGDAERWCKQTIGDPGSVGCTDQEQEAYITPDFGWRDGFRGLAASIDGVRLGQQKLSLRAFGSYQRRSVSRSEIYNAANCLDPRDDGDSACAAPTVFVRQDDPTLPAPRYTYATLPDVYDEAAAGGNLSLAVGSAARVGFTGYAARDLFRIEGISLDFQESARAPMGGQFGAIGLDGALRLGGNNLFLEASRSFDSEPGGGGGYALVQRTAVGLEKQELELTLRYYDRAFANPYSRAASASDLLDGLSARNEAGARFRYSSRRLADWTMRAAADFWVLPGDAYEAGTAGLANFDAGGRADLVRWRWFQPALLLDYRNKNLGVGGRGRCYDRGEDRDDNGQPIRCAGERYRAGLRGRFEPLRWLVLSVQYSHTLVDDRDYPDFFRQDASIWADAAINPLPSLRVKLRGRYLDEDTSDDASLEKSVSGYLSVHWKPVRGLSTSIRLDLVAFLNQPESSLRSTVTQQRLRLDYEMTF